MPDPVPAEPKASNLLTQMRALGIWPNDQSQQQTVDEIASRCNDDRQIARQLIDRDLLTSYQANKILTGDAQSLAIGPYIVLERLGEGGMGRVYKARHQRLQKLVALKVIRAERLGNPVAIRRFYREIEAVAKLSHPNIVWAFDADHAGDLHYFAMQYVPGRDMSRLVKQGGPLDVQLAAEYFRQAALGLQHIHEHGMVHRDIKPSNLLIVEAKAGASESGSSQSLSATVKIVDLGLTRGPENEDRSRLTQMGTTMGTVDYMSPEQARASHEVDIRSDIYSLGCSMYFALTGRPPFVAESPVEKMMAHQMEQAAPVEQLRPEAPVVLGAIVRRMIAKKPADRFQTPHEVAAALDAFRKNEPVPLGPASPATPVRAIPVNAPPPKAIPVNPVNSAAETFGFADAVTTPVVVNRHRQSRKRDDPTLWVKIAGMAVVALMVLIVVIWFVMR